MLAELQPLQRFCFKLFYFVRGNRKLFGNFFSRMRSPIRKTPFEFENVPVPALEPRQNTC